MQEHSEFTPEMLQSAEPPEDAMIYNMQPIDKPISRAELLFGLFTVFFTLLALIPWPPLRISVIVVVCCFCGFELFLLLIPPRLSWFRISALFAMIFHFTFILNHISTLFAVIFHFTLFLK